MQPTRVFLALAFAPLAFSQAQPQFEVASIKPSVEGANNTVNIGIHIDGAQFSCNSFSLVDYVRTAYDVKQYQVIAPDWMASARFDIKGRLPEGSNRDQVREMVKALLMERFHLKVHKESKEFPVYALEVAKGGAKLKKTPVDPAADPAPVTATNAQATGGPQGVNVNMGNGTSFTFADNKIEVTKMDMKRFAEMLARFSDKPVIYMTGLTGNYDFVIKMTEEDYRAMQIRSAISAGVVLPPQAMRLLELSSGDSVASAMQALGLKMESRKAPLEVIVIDSADKTPTDN
jgi:uncharacterized protein (TIGR03435 family)